jgi:RHS repeat-associated protein
VRFLTDNAGAVTDSYDYDAFGLPITTTGTTPNTYLYSGEQFDSAAGLYYLRARYYNPPTGRFETMDPVAGKIADPKTLHKYVLTGNNPVNWIDPRGTELEENEEILEGDEIEEVESRFESLKKYQNLSSGPGYRISTEGTEDELEQSIQQFIEQWNAK